MREIKACGFLIVRGNPVHSFLLMQHPTRWDLPKGHVDGNETELECAWRELAEETGLTVSDVAIVPGFEFRTSYTLFSQRFNEKCHKSVVIFLARLQHEVELTLTEHGSFKWFPWQPPHQIQPQTIDPLLAAAETFFAQVSR